MLAPIAFMFFNVRPMRTRSDLYLVFFVPYILVTMNLFFFGMWLRNYSVRGIWLASALSFSTFWIYMKAGLVALFGLKRAFGVTPKGVGGGIPITQMIPEGVMFLSNCLVAIMGMYYLVSRGWSVAYLMNTIWAAYHAVLLSTLFFYFNRPVTLTKHQGLFAPFMHKSTAHVAL
jgi:cellulose synthase (UDP-forming)